jgi:hypothetical protein
MTATETRKQRAERVNQERKDRIKANKKRVRKAFRLKWGVRGLIGVGIAGAIFVGLLVGALVFQGIVWNLGVVGLAAACGATVAKIGFWTGFGAVFLTTTLKSIISGTDSSKLNLNRE